MSALESKPLDPPVSWNRELILQKVAYYSHRAGIIGSHFSQLLSSIGEISLRIFIQSRQISTQVADVGAQLGVVSVISVPIRIYNITQVVRSKDKIKNKVVDISLHLGGLYSTSVIITSLALKGVKTLARAMPYLVGVSIIFQAAELYKRSMMLIRAQRMVKTLNNNETFKELLGKIKNNTLSEEEKIKISHALKLDQESLKPFCEDVADVDNPEKVKKHLQERANRVLISHRVHLIACAIEMIASVLILAAFFVAPPIGAALAIANASVLSSTAAIKIAMFIYDFFTRDLKISKPPVEMTQLRSPGRYTPPVIPQAAAA